MRRSSEIWTCPEGTARSLGERSVIFAKRARIDRNPGSVELPEALVHGGASCGLQFLRSARVISDQVLTKIS